jgi:Tetratricopeptide repeat
MRKHQKNHSFVIILSSIFLLNNTTSGLAQQQGVNIVSEVQGNVEVQHNGRNKYQQVYLGEPLSSADKLRLKSGALAKILCSNLKIWNLDSVGEFEVALGCPSKEQILKRRGSDISGTRTVNYLNIPYLVSPRNTAILTQQPTLRWHLMKNATSYVVQISGEGVNWTTKVNQSMVFYPGSQPLQAGFLYQVNITANNGASTKDFDEVAFYLLSKEDIQQVKAEVALVEQQHFNNVSQAIALAHLYKSHNLNTDAIDVLTALVKDGKQVMAVYQLLGNIYQQVGLNELARDNYLTALKQAKVEGNLEGQAISQLGLGEVDQALGKSQQAILFYQAAQASYRALGDEAQVQKLQRKLDNLKR